MTRYRRSVRAALLLVLLLSAMRPTHAADLQSRLNADLKGSWVVIVLETGSSCDSSYTSNKVLGTRVLSTAPYRLPAGELGRIAKIDVKRSRVDILIEIDEPYLVSWADGPFQLFDQARCRVELEVEVPREWVKKKMVAEFESLLAAILEQHEDQESVTRSERWNRREVEPLPDGYAETFTEYRVWKGEQLRGELLVSLDRSLRDAQRVIDRADDDPAYGAGFTAGLEKEADRYRSWDDCEDLVDETFYPNGRGAPSGFEGADEREWKKGYKEGQIVAFNVALARRIGDCLGEL